MSSKLTPPKTNFSIITEMEIGLVYSPHRNGFVLNWTVLEKLKEYGHPEAISFLSKNTKPSNLNYNCTDETCVKHYPVSLYGKGSEVSYFMENRDDPLLVKVIKELGENICKHTILEVKTLTLNPDETFKIKYRCSMSYGYDDSEEVLVVKS
jgi:hypothetical protein